MLFGDLLSKFVQFSTWGNLFFIRDIFKIQGLSSTICDLKYITFYESYNFCKAPSNFSDNILMKINYARKLHYDEDPELFK